MTIQKTLKHFLVQHTFKRLYIAVSGGIDSMVLLHAISQLDIMPVEVIHINHHIHAESQKWADFVAKIASENNLKCHILDVTLDKSLGIEEAARHARYHAISEHTTDDDLVLTAHHLNDQKETLIFRALRGTGMQGLRGMQPISYIYQCRVGRPFLPLPKKVLEDYAHQHQLSWIDDPSNCDLTLNRNAIRRALNYLDHLNGFSITQAHIEKQSKVVDICVQNALSVSLIAPHILCIHSLSQHPLVLQEMVFHRWLTTQVGTINHQKVNALFNAFISANLDRYPQETFQASLLLRYRNCLTVLSLPKQSMYTVLSDNEWIDLGVIGKIYNPDQQKLMIQPLAAKKSRFKKRLQSLGVPLWLREHLPMINQSPLIFDQSKPNIFWHPPLEWRHWLSNLPNVNDPFNE
ncbi:MAG: tRNA lysidine(34) synthetase TilS [Pseudomonadota bacterium]|nr:tRNA lysidine(34) synthetase TilS [Pseudomonadota bacterium]